MTQNKTSKSPAPKAARVAPATAPVKPEQDFVLKDLKSSADDVVKLAYGSMTLPPQQFLDLFSKVGEQYMSFVAKRMQAQADRVQSLSRCSNIEDVAKSEMAFFGKAAEDYAQQIERMAEATHGAAEQAGSALKS